MQALNTLFRNFIIKILELEARLVLKKYKPKIVAVTGTVGKTGTKDAIYTVLSQFFHVRKSEKSFNSEVGIPLTILACPTGWRNPLIWLSNAFKGFWLLVWPHKYPKWLVLEVGVRKPGDIDYITKYVHPDVSVITAFGKLPVHVEFFEAKEDLWREKAKLAKALPHTGTLILNYDDPNVFAIKEDVKCKTITFGQTHGAMIHMTDMNFEYDKKTKLPVGVNFHIEYEGKSLPVLRKGVIGKTHLYNIGGALAVAYGEGLSMTEAMNSLEKLETPTGRMRLIPGVKGTMVIDDTYNSSPLASETALETFELLDAPGRKILVFGDMLELGKYSDEAHEELGKMAAGFCDVIITVGIRSRFFANAAQAAGFPKEFLQEVEDSKEAGKIVETMLEEGDVVLVKGSQGMRMERTVKEIMAEPQRAYELLARQEKEWLAKV